MKRERQIQYSEKIEEGIDAIIECVLSDSHVEHDGSEQPVSSGTWLEIKTHVLALLSLDEE